MNNRDIERLEKLEPGYYLQKDSIIRVVKLGNGHKVALRQNEEGYFKYERGLIFKIFPNHRVDETVGS